MKMSYDPWMVAFLIFFVLEIATTFERGWTAAKNAKRERYRKAKKIDVTVLVDKRGKFLGMNADSDFFLGDLCELHVVEVPDSCIEKDSDKEAAND